MDHLVGSGYPHRLPSSPSQHQHPGPIQAPANDFPHLDRGMNPARAVDNVPLPPEQLQPTAMGAAAAAPPITSLDTQDPAGIRDDLGPHAYYPTNTAPLGFGPGYVHYGAGGYGPGRIRFDWQHVICMEPPYQGGLT